MNRKILGTLAAGVIVLSGCSRAPSASSTKEYQYDWSGNTVSGVETKLSTNFAVLDANGGTAGDPWASGFANFAAAFVPGRDFQGHSSPGLDTGAQYLYLYQDVNRRDSASLVDESRLEILPAVVEQITSWGYFKALGFADAQGVVGPDNVFGDQAHGTDPHAPQMGVDLPKVVDVGGLDDTVTHNPVTVILNPDFFIRVYSTPNSLKPGERGTLVGFTTNLPPTTAGNHVHPDPNEPAPAHPANPGAITEGSPIAVGVLKLVNLVTGQYLEDTVHITEGAAGRIGSHARFNSLAEVLALVTDADFQILVRFAEDNGYVTGG